MSVRRVAALAPLARGLSSFTPPPGLLGAKLTQILVVDEARGTGFINPDVYSTPSMITDMEYQIRDMILPHLDDGSDTVGIRVDFDHTAATLIGQEVEIVTEVVKVEDRKVTSSCKIRDKVGVLGVGFHERFIVDMEKTVARLKHRDTELENTEW